MVQDNPYLEVWRSLSLDQTKLNIFCKSNLDWTKLGKWSSSDMVSPQPIYNLSSPFCANCWQREREIHKDSKIGEANKWNDIVKGKIKKNAHK